MSRIANFVLKQTYLMVSFIKRQQMSYFLTSGSLAFAKTKSILSFCYRISQSSQRGIRKIDMSFELA